MKNYRWFEIKLEFKEEWKMLIFWKEKWGKHCTKRMIEVIKSMNLGESWKELKTLRNLNSKTIVKVGTF